MSGFGTKVLGSARMKSSTVWIGSNRKAGIKDPSTRSFLSRRGGLLGRGFAGTFDEKDGQSSEEKSSPQSR